MSKSKTNTEEKKDLSATGIVAITEHHNVQLFHTSLRVPFARFWVKDHWETCPIKSVEFEGWLCAMCYHLYHAVPNQKALAEAKNTLAGHAAFASPEHEIYVRIAGHDGAIYLDLCNDSWEAVRISAEGWDVVPHTPIKFIRTPGMRALPHPIDGGRIDLLRPFLNVQDDDQWRLAVSFLVGALRPNGPFPLLVLGGTHDSAKSSCSRILKSLVDPSAAPLRGAPRNEQDLAISAGNSWCLGFDNLSIVKPWLSDALCRLATGSGFATRALYTDDREKIFEGMRPVMLNGIEIDIERPDLLDRAIVLDLPPISEESRQTEANFWGRFEVVRPKVFGSLLDAVACALSRLPQIKLTKTPRMADFATWVCAAEPALGWPEGAFLEAYERNRQQANSLALEASALAKPIMRIADHASWKGTATELLGEVNRALLEEIPIGLGEPSPKIPQNPRDLSAALRRIAPNLHHVGVNIEFCKTPGDNSQRVISITKSCNGCDGAPQTGEEVCTQKE